MKCDYFGCSLKAVAEFPILDDDGEDQGAEMLCAKHHPAYQRGPFAAESWRQIDDWLSSIKVQPQSNLSTETTPLEFKQVARLVQQTEALNKIRNHKTL